MRHVVRRWMGVRIHSASELRRGAILLFRSTAPRRGREGPLDPACTTTEHQ